MPRNAREGVLFSFTMSALMIYIMAALNFGVRTGDFGWTAWNYAVVNFPHAFVIGMICDLALCTPLSRAIMHRVCRDSDRPVWKGLVIKFSMVVLMTVCMTIYGVIAAVGFQAQAAMLFFITFPYNFTIALPIQMLLIAPIAGRLVHFVGNKAGWHQPDASKADVRAADGIHSLIVRDPYVVSVHASVRDAIATMVDKQVSGLPVVREDGTLCGYVSEHDVVRHFAGSGDSASIHTLLTRWATGATLHRFTELMDANVMEIADHDVVSFDETGDFAELCELFELDRLRKVPVVSADKLVGVIHRSTVTRRAMESYLRPEAA